MSQPQSLEGVEDQLRDAVDSAVFYSGDKTDPRTPEQVRIDMLLRIVARLMHRQGMSEQEVFEMIYC